MAKDYYLILGVPIHADPREIRSAYRDLAKEHHPDSGGKEKRFREVREAYEVLSDPERRSGYDRSRRRRSAGRTRSTAWKVTPSADSSNTRAAPFRPASARPGIPFSRTGKESQQFLLVLSPREAQFCEDVPVPLTFLSLCDTCQGSGALRSYRCPQCRGEGGERESMVLRVPVPASVRHGSVLDFLIQPPRAREIHLQIRVQIEGRF